ncbi:MAG: hypothetical protein ACMVO3_22645 [Thalassobaculum sp.]
MTITIVDVETRSGWRYFTDTAEVRVSRIPYLPLLMSTGGFRRHLFSPGSTLGAGQSEAEPILLANADRALDDLHRSVDGRRIIVRQGEPDSEGRPPRDLSSYTVVFQGRMDPADFTGDVVRLQPLNRQTVISEGLVTETRFDGTATSGGAGLGGSVDLAGKPHPLLVGYAYNVEPAAANPFDQIYMVSQGWPGHSAVLHFVKDRGVSITPDTQHATLADLRAVAEAASITTSRYDWYSGDDGTWFALGSLPAGIVTVEATEGGGRTTAETAEFLLERSSEVTAGLVQGVAAMNSFAPGESGIFVGTEDRTIGSALEQVLELVGYWHDALDGSGVVVGAWREPEGSDQTISENETLDDIDLLSTNDVGGGAPVKEVLVGYRRNYTPLTKSDLDATAAVSDALALSQEFLVTTPATVADAVARNPLAQTMRLNTSFRYAADAERIRDRQRDMRASGIDLFKVPVATTTATAGVGRGVTVTNRRHGLTRALCGVLGRESAGRTVDNIAVTDLIIWRPSP